MRIETEWLDGRGVLDEAEAATWARIEMHVDGVIATELFDVKSGSARKGFFGPALPIAEWLADVWPRLLHERRDIPPGSGAWAEWAGFHNLRAARAGGAMPDLRLVRYNEEEIRVRLVHDGDRLLPGMTVRFLNDADACIDVRTVEAELARFVEAALERASAVRSQRVDRLRDRWRRVRVDGALAFAGRLGIDDEAMEEGDEAALRSVIGGPDADLLLGISEGSTASTLSGRIDEARAALALVPQGMAVTERWADLGRLALRRKEKPWLTGWDAARALREIVGVDDREAPMSGLAAWIEEKCGWPAEGQLFDLPRRVGELESVHLQRRGQTPVVATTIARQEARRFRLARTLYYFLFARPGENAAFADSPVACGERSEANAFAAELLAPVARLKAMSPPGGIWSQERVDEAAGALHVSPLVITHQISNRKLGALSD